MITLPMLGNVAVREVREKSEALKDRYFLRKDENTGLRHILSPGKWEFQLSVGSVNFVRGM